MVTLFKTSHLLVTLLYFMAVTMNITGLRLAKLVYMVPSHILYDPSCKLKVNKDFFLKKKSYVQYIWVHQNTKNTAKFWSSKMVAPATVLKHMQLSFVFFFFFTEKRERKYQFSGSADVILGKPQQPVLYVPLHIRLWATFISDSPCHTLCLQPLTLNVLLHLWYIKNCHFFIKHPY